jgi:glycosyltransferase involved in cell wall biosynthesis
MCVRNEDVFVERAIRNIERFCDRILVVDHVSTDRTPEILSDLTKELDHLVVRRDSNSAAAHRMLESFAGTQTWVLRVDGDELYDPAGLARTRRLVDEGAFAAAFRVQCNVLHCDELGDDGLAHGYLSPPGRPITALYNFGALNSWRGAADRLMGGDVRFRDGYTWNTVDTLQERHSFDESPLRYIHTCFLRRSSVDPEGGGARPSLGELGAYRRGRLGSLLHRLRPTVDSKVREIHARGSTWKDDKYRRGPRVEVDATPFLGGTGDKAAARTDRPEPAPRAASS